MRIVVRIGGSVIASPINAKLIKRYITILKTFERKGHELFVVVGGGSVARDLIQVARELKLNERTQDELAISASRLVAQLFVEGLDNMGCGVVPSTIDDALSWGKKGKIVVMGGLKPGMTTDTVASLIAERVKADLYTKVTDQDGVYDKDPRKHPDAVKLDRIQFKDLSKILVQNTHKAGIHQVLDPEAVKLLKKCKVRVVIVNGQKPENLLMAVKGRQVGTIIE